MLFPYVMIALPLIIWGIIDVCKQPVSVIVKLLLSLLFIFTTIIGLIMYFVFIRPLLKSR